MPDKADTMQDGSLSRRRFLGRILLAALAAGLKRVPLALAATPVKPVFNTMPLRMLGKTKEMVAALGLSGSHLSSIKEEDKAVALIREAMKLEGKTVIDLVWEADGAVRRVAKALSGGDRKKAFLVTGTDKLDKKACLQELIDTLRRLGTDRIDLWMIKEGIFEAGPDHVFSKEGAIGAALDAREKGMITHIGFAGSRNTDFFVAAMEGFYDFGVAEIPLNGNGSLYTRMEETIFPHMRTRSIGTIVSNPLPDGPDAAYPLDPAQILSLMWSQLITAVAAGVDSIKALHAYADIARHYRTVPRPLRGGMMEKLARMKPHPDSPGKPAAERKKAT
jgi:diketogulonate reductase-like aldo/keto reductase